MKDNIPYSILSSCRAKSPIVREALAEFIGTFLLNIMATGAGAAYTLKGHNSTGDIFGAGFGAGIGLFLGVLVSASISGGHINPVVTIGFASVRKISWKKVPIYLLAQYLGAFLGSAIVFSNYFNAINAYDFGKRSAFGTNISTGQIFTTFPNQNETIGGALLDQTICAGILLFAIMSLTDKRNLNIPAQAVPILVGLTLVGIIVSFGLNCGAALNPARDLSARIFLIMVGYDGSDVFRPLQSLYWLIGGVIGPHVGGIVGAWLYLMFIELHHNVSGEI